MFDYICVMDTGGWAGEVFLWELGLEMQWKLRSEVDDCCRQLAADWWEHSYQSAAAAVPDWKTLTRGCTHHFSNIPPVTLNSDLWPRPVNFIYIKSRWITSSKVFHFYPCNAVAMALCLFVISQYCVETAEWIKLVFGVQATFDLSYIYFSREFGYLQK